MKGQREVVTNTKPTFLYIYSKGRKRKQSDKYLVK